jgi:hypothetical protein
VSLRTFWVLCVVGASGACRSERLAAVPQTDDRFVQGASDQNVLTFVQKAAVVDVLFVVRNGPAMCEKQQQLATKFTSFISALDQESLDFHVAVTSTDFSSTQFQGKFVAAAGNPFVLDAGTTNLTQVFTQNVLAVGDTASPLSQGLLAALAAVTPPLSTGWNAGFLRQNASLAVIAVSDEDDYSLSVPPPSEGTDYYATFFTRSFAHLKSAGNENLVSVSAIIGADAGIPADCEGTASNPSCVYNDATGHAGYRYAAVANGTGGLIQPICASDFGPLLSTLAAHIGGLTRSYDLANVPLGESLNPNTITITVTPVGQPSYVVPQDTLNGWSYDQANEAIDFAGTGIPPPGANVVISYALLQRAFPLTHFPQIPTLEVQVTHSGTQAVIPETTTDPTTGWTFDPASISIVFGANSIPAVGDTVDVSYQY